MNILFVSDEAPMSGNFNGAASYKFSHLRLLMAHYPEARFTILTLHTGNHPGIKSGEQPARDELSQHYPRRAVEYRWLDLTRQPAPRRGRQRKLLAPGLGRLAFFYPLASDENVARLREMIAAAGPDLIWTEQLLENYLVLQGNPAAPVVYSQTDFIWKIRQLRQAGFSPAKRLLNLLFRGAESALIRRNRYLVSGSLTELAEVKRLQPAMHTAFLPTAYDSQAVPPQPGPVVPRLMHLGTLRATANRVGLVRFMQVCWPALRGQLPGVELHVVGSLDASGVEEVKSLLGQPGVRTYGFVEDLAGVLRPYDIHIIPYEHNTGTRTRLSLALNFNQVLVGTRSACSGIDGLVDGENCILVDTLDAMTAALVRLLRGETDYKAIADRGKALFEREFTFGGQRRRMALFLAGIEGIDLK
jgi:hypothetical protein